MGRRWGVAHIGADRKITVLVLKHSIEHDELLAPRMGMCRELAVRRIPHDGRGAGNFAPNSVQHAPLYPLRGRGSPFRLARTHHDTLGKISVNPHETRSFDPYN